MRRSMDFGPLGDIETLMRARGLSLAPMSTGEASLVDRGVAVLPTARVEDIQSGELKGLVVPGGVVDAEGDKAARILIEAARAVGAPILALGSGVGDALAAAGGDPARYADAPAVLMDEAGVTVLEDRDALTAAAGRIG